MKKTVANSTIELVGGDITLEKTEAIVNAANSSLLGGGGVDGAIHRAGGPQILEECRKIGGCPAGEARITSGGNLSAKYVIHTVGPIYNGGNSGEAATLANAYKNCLIKATEIGIKTVSFPSISTGVYGYPISEASMIALGEAKKYLEEHSEITLVRFVLFGKKDYHVYEKSLRAILKN